MIILRSFLLGYALFSSAVAFAARHPKGAAKRVAWHAKEARQLNPNMHFRRSPHPAPMLDLHAHSPEKFKTVRAQGNYKFK
jgi:hypothetical protein